MEKDAILEVASESKEPVDEPSATPAKKPLWARLLTPKWLIILIGASLVVHGIGFAYYQGADRAGSTAPDSEIGLGIFRFEAKNGEGGPIANAEFSLHIALLDKVSRDARDRLQARRFRIQQDIEELLRQAHSADFEDPSLGELKRQLQEKVNETLGVRVIADVIITNLSIQQREGETHTVADTADKVPWVDEPSS